MIQQKYYNLFNAALLLAILGFLLLHDWPVRNKKLKSTLFQRALNSRRVGIAQFIQVSTTSKNTTTAAAATTTTTTNTTTTTSNTIIPSTPTTTSSSIFGTTLSTSTSDTSPTTTRTSTTASTSTFTTSTNFTISHRDFTMSHSLRVTEFIDRKFPNTTYKSLFEKIYSKYGYSVCISNLASSAIPFLPLVKATTCDAVFSDWLKVNTKPSKQRSPPEQVPNESREEFLLQGHARLGRYYFGNEAQNMQTTLFWNNKTVTDNLDKIRDGKWTQIGWYGAEGAGLINACVHYPLSGHGLVIGSLAPWVEAICLFCGATNLTTAEYQPVKSEDPRLNWVHPVDLAQNWRQVAQRPFDFVASFSSIEHSGLGRYGDNLDPFGDVREMEKVWCLLKPGGLFLIGVPTGSDAVEWNAHRIYGPVRWPMMIAGYKVLDAFYEDKLRIGVEGIREFVSKRTYRQAVLVLQKQNLNACEKVSV